MEQAIAIVREWAAVYGIRVIGAVVIFVVGRWLAKAVATFLRRIMEKRNVDRTLSSFGGNIVYAMLLAFVAVAALSKLGIQTASFVAVLGAAGLAVGLALQGSLSNFAAGVLVILFRPFKVGDVIDGAGVIGVVEDLHLFTTQLRTGDNKTVFVPNGKLLGDNIVNYSTKETRRVDLVVGVGYGEDVDRVKEVLSEILGEDERVLGDPAPTVAVLELADSSVNFAVRPWVKTEDYWSVYFDLHEKVKKRFDAEGISIPFPQRDVHLFSVQAGGGAAAG